MVNVSKIVKGLTNIGSDAFSHVHIKAPQPNPEGEEKLTGEMSKQASDAISSYGKAAVKKQTNILKTSKDYEEEMKILLKKTSKTKETDTMSLEEAVKEFDMIELPEKQKADLLLACTFQTKTNETIISKPALYMTKYVVLDCYGKVPNKLDKAIKTAIYDDGKVFDVDYFYDLFQRNTWKLKRSAELKRSQTGSNELAHFNMARKGEVYEALRAHSTKRTPIKITTNDIFTPLDKVGENLSYKLDALGDEGVNIPDDLKNTMKKALSEYNFDLKKVYADYYSLLKECKTLEDVKTFYPELRFPTELIKKDFNTNTKIDLSIRMQKGGIDKPVIEALQKLYTEFTPPSKTFIHIDGSTSTNVTNFKRAGYELSQPDEKIMDFLKECEITQLKYRKISKMSKETLEPIIEKHALRTSGVWKDFLEQTKTGKWMPIRFIKNKRAYPDTTKYSTEKLVDTYLFNLFVKNPYQRYSSNPLSRFDKIGYLDDHAHGIINRTYMIRFLTKEKDMPANMSEIEWAKVKTEFEEFKQRFDLEAIGKSIEHMEDNYHRHFYRNYWTNARYQTLQKQMQTSQDIAYEKVLWGEDLRKKEVNIEQVKQIVKSEDSLAETGTKLIDEKNFRDYKYKINSIKDPKLREKFMGAINLGQESNQEYFNVFNNILKESDLGKNIDETKAKALINIHENYLSEVFEGAQDLTEAQYTQQFLAKYQTPDGIDFAKVLADTEAESKYWELASKLIDNNATNFVTELERRYKDDFVGINEIMEKYLDTPDIFKEKISNIYTLSNPNCPNTVLQRELTAFLDKVQCWHFDRDEIIALDKARFGQNNDKFSQNIVIPRELKEKLWELSGKNYESFDEIIQKLYQSGQKRTGDSKGNGIKTWVGKDYDAELKILGKWGGWRLYAREATPQDIEKYGQVKYVFYDAAKTH
ncbi:hypothetical protein IJ674_08695 [bacterium]|nr:hypothetical protein [bacterium]